MDKNKLERLQQCAIRKVKERASDAEKSLGTTRLTELRSLRIAAFMDIKKTTESLEVILEYKKEAAKQMLRCLDEKQMDTIAGVMMQADNMIKTILGMYIP